eukprot:2643826-Prymnesium_polylepis.1
MRDAAAKGCEAHGRVINIVDANNSKRLLVDGEYVSLMTFEQAFPHHVDYVCCRAKGIFGEATGKKPIFRKYVRGEQDPQYTQWEWPLARQCS